MNDTFSENKKYSNRIIQGGKYLTFSLGGEVYGFEILKIIEIIGFMDITSIPQLPNFIPGVINLRDNVIPVMDMRARFHMEAKEVDDETVIIILQTNKGSMGVIVDNVLDVIHIADESIEETPDFGANINTEYILGLGKNKDKVIILLSVEDLLTEEIQELVTTSEELQLEKELVAE